MPDLGLRVGARAVVESLGLFGRLIRRTRTLGEALDACVRYQPMFTSTDRMWLVPRDERIELHGVSRSYLDLRDPAARRANQLSAGNHDRDRRLAGGPRVFRPRELHPRLPTMGRMLAAAIPGSVPRSGLMR